jgi:hypothetical protein
MNVNITGIYDNTVIVDSNLFDDVRLLQTGLSSLNDTFIGVVEGLPLKYADLTSFSILNSNYYDYKIYTDENITTLNNNVSTISNNYINHTTLSILTDETTTYINEKITEQQEYTDQEIETLRNEGLIQEAVMQILAWATSDEGKRFRKKVWDRIKLKWLNFTGKRPYTGLIDDIQQETTNEFDDMLKVYGYKMDFASGTSIAGIRSDTFAGKEIVMKGDTYI